MQLTDEALALVPINNECQVQVIGSLRHQVNFFLLEYLQGWCESRQNGANFSANQADRRAIHNHTYATKCFEVANEFVNQLIW